MGVNLVGLTGRASFDVLFGILFHVRPPEVAFHQFVRIANSGVSSRRGFVVKMNYPPLQIVFPGNDSLAVLVRNPVLLRELVRV